MKTKGDGVVYKEVIRLWFINGYISHSIWNVEEFPVIGNTFSIFR